MSPLEPTFELSPRSMTYYVAPNNKAYLGTWGCYVHPPGLDPFHADDELYYWTFVAGDPTLDYAHWANIVVSPCLRLSWDLSAFGADRQLFLLFGFRFDAHLEDEEEPEKNAARLLVYSPAGQLGDVTLIPGDNQFMIEVEGLGVEGFWNLIYFIHSRFDGVTTGGSWHFTGITGYVV